MEITITFVGNATTLISSGDITVLTDPNFLHRGQRAYLGHGLVSKRLKEPALSADRLPPVDAIVLSHLHGDHWDRVTEKHLNREPLILTTPAAAKRLHSKGFDRASGVSTWLTHTIVKGDVQLTVTSLPGRHAPMRATGAAGDGQHAGTARSTGRSFHRRDAAPRSGRPGDRDRAGRRRRAL